MAEEFGTGIEIDQDFDFVVDNGGDIGVASGNRELSKDMSLAVVEILETGSADRLGPGFDGVTIPDSIEGEGLVSVVFDPGIARDVEVLVADILNSDPRIEFVTSVAAERVRGERGTVEIRANVQLIDAETQQLEFVLDI